MPDHLVARITARLEDERRGDGDAEVLAFPGPETTPPSRRFILGLAAAATVAAVAGVVGVNALRDPGTQPAVAALTSSLVRGATVHTSGTAYTATRLGEQATHVASQSTPAPAPSPAALGSFGSEAGVGACLRGIGLDTAADVAVDVATFDGRPAAIVVATTDGARTARVVPTTCSESDRRVLFGPVAAT